MDLSDIKALARAIGCSTGGSKKEIIYRIARRPLPPYESEIDGTGMIYRRFI